MRAKHIEYFHCSHLLRDFIEFVVQHANKVVLHRLCSWHFLHNALHELLDKDIVFGLVTSIILIRVLSGCIDDCFRLVYSTLLDILCEIVAHFISLFQSLSFIFIYFNLQIGRPLICPYYVMSQKS